MNENKQIIFILDDNINILTILKNYLILKMPNVDVYDFSNYDDMKNHELLKKVSLFILDIKLKTGLSGDQIAIDLGKITNATFLLMSGFDYEFDSFDSLNLTYDFINKPFNLNLIINRIKVLLKVSETYNHHINERTKLTVSLKELFNYTNIYLLILDENMIVKLCSYKLWKDLGYNSENDIVGQDWKQFVDEKDREKISDVHKNVIEDSIEYQKSYREISTKILTQRNSTLTVKWFNSRIANSKTYTFSIGIPYNRTVTEADEIESIRAYWKYVIDKDETTLMALKSNVKEQE